MGGHWSLAYSYRLRLTPTTDANGNIQLVIPHDALNIIGASAGDEYVCVVAPNGGITIRKAE